jgi:hypothetical protein
MREPGGAMKKKQFGKWMASLSLGFGMAAAFVIFFGPAMRSQGPPRDIINRPAPMPTDPVPNSDYDPIQAQRQRTALNIERQKELVSDTNKLLKLAKELDYEVDAGGTGTLTPDQLRMAATIEKLARSVKEKMSGGTTGQPGPPMVLSPSSYPH